MRNRDALRYPLIVSIRMVHVVTDLRMGGAESALANLIAKSDKARFQHHVIGLKSDGVIGDRLRETGARVDVVGIRSVAKSIQALWKIRRLIRESNADLVQGWMYHGNVAASLALRSMRHRAGLIWNVRHSLTDFSREKPMTRHVIKMGARMSEHAELILWNSKRSRIQHEALGYHGRRHMVIPNGIDTSKMTFRVSARESMRKRLGLNDDALLVGSVARHHPMKGHTDLIDAVSHLASKGRDVHLALCGRGCEEDGSMATLAKQSSLQGRLHLLGEMADPQPVYAAMDCFVVSSRWGESFPNALVEAMACEVPAIATDLGASAEILGDSGDVVPADTPHVLAPAIDRTLMLPPLQRKERVKKGRQRVINRFDVHSSVNRYERIWSSIAARFL